MSQDEKREKELRSLAERQGVLLEKVDKGTEESTEEDGYRIVTPGDNSPIAGDESNDHVLSLDEVARWLTNDEATAQANTVSDPDGNRKASRGSETRNDAPES
ncbi:MAG: hypothetical protein R3A46_19010 [Thermomicrobiales bacterium]